MKVHLDWPTNCTRPNEGLSNRHKSCERTCQNQKGPQVAQIIIMIQSHYNFRNAFSCLLFLHNASATKASSERIMAIVWPLTSARLRKRYNSNNR